MIERLKGSEYMRRPATPYYLKRSHKIVKYGSPYYTDHDSAVITTTNIRVL